MARKKKILTEIEDAAITIVDKERSNWEDSVCYVTEKVGFRMRPLIRLLRKNYWGVFDQPIDSQTGREKIWIGLVMSTIEIWLKNIDIGQKDINFIARNPNGFALTELTRLIVKDYLDRVYFGETLDTDERQVLIDGTLVWKTWEDNSSGKPVMRRRTVDLLNVYIDPTEESIQSAYRFTERSVQTLDQIRGMDWDNTDKLDGSTNLSKIDGDISASHSQNTTGEYRDVWEMWGKIPKWMITQDKSAPDAYHEIDGHIIISGLDGGSKLCHLVEENTKKDKFGAVIKPYEEWRVSKISGRWYGLGVAERILALQEYLNTVINIRINRGYVSQLGLFKIKKGRGITAQMLNRLPVNGAIQVQDMDDIEQFEVAEAGTTSYKDEEVIKYWGQQITSAFPISSGETMPASSTATSAAIANANAKSAYTMFKENTGMFIERWMDRHALPIIAKTLDKDELIRLSSDDEKFKELVERVALYSVSEALDKSPVIPSEEELLLAVAQEEERLMKSGNLFLKKVQDLVADAVDTKCKVTNEDLDTSVTISNLIEMMQLAPEYRDEMLKQVYDLMGLQMPKKKPQPQMIGAAPMAQQGQSLQSQTLQANKPALPVNS